MLAVKYTDIGHDFKKWCDRIIDGETVVVSNPKNESIYMINESEYKAFQKAKQNAEYFAMLNKSEEQLQRGETITFTFEELKEMELEDWKPTEKVLEFEQKHGIQRRGVIENGWFYIYEKRLGALCLLADARPENTKENKQSDRRY